MQSILHGSWISAGREGMESVPLFRKAFSCRNVSRATLYITALGVYEAHLNGQRVGDFILAPGWTNYRSRLQVQQYDVTSLLSGQNTLTVLVGRGWYASRLGWHGQQAGGRPVALLAALHLECEGGASQDIVTDESWEWTESQILSSTIYDGESVDGRRQPEGWSPAVCLPLPKDILIPQEGEKITEQERLSPIAVLQMPRGETVLDFGQNMTGYVEFSVRGPAGAKVTLRHAEVLDRDGNFYTDNLRSAKAEFSYILSGGEDTVRPRFTFFGFRYVQVMGWPEEIKPESFTAIAVHSDMKRTGQFECGSDMVNRLYRNIVWGQKGNFLDVPTDCPQRDERLGWTGDAQVFIRAAAYNYDVNRFFRKWLHDLKSEQFFGGCVPAVIPNALSGKARHDGFVPYGEKEAQGPGDGSAAWGDATCVCPWQMYLSYGDATLLAEQFDSMRAWVEYIRSRGGDECLWNTGFHYGDWLGLDALSGSYKGSTDEGLIATAMYAYSTSLLVKAGKALGRDVGEYETLHGRIVSAFRQTYMSGGKLTCLTQTAHVLALHFKLCENPAEVAASLAKLIANNGTHLTTGFVGTPYLLHALSGNGYTELAYSLLLQESYPSWLFSVKMGATTIWEHWDGMREDGTMWSADMNSFNHYAYGAVGDWLFGVAAGLQPVEDEPGYARIRIAPRPDRRLGFVKASLETKNGLIRSQWRYEGEQVRYEIEIPKGATAEITIGPGTYMVASGIHRY